MKKICEVVPYQFEGYYLVSFDKRWFERHQVSKFEVMVDNNDKLILRSIHRNEGNEK